MRLYAHSQAEALKAARGDFEPNCDIVVTLRAGSNIFERRFRW